MQDCQEVGTFCFLQPQHFVDSVEFKTQDCFCCGIFAIKLSQLLLQNWIIGIILISWENVMDASQCACTDVAELFAGRWYD